MNSHIFRKTLLCAAIAAALPALAPANDWTGSAGNQSWSDPLNWSAGVPAAGDDVFLVEPISTSVNYDYGLDPILNNLHISGGMTLNQAGNLLTTHATLLGDNATNTAGFINQSSGTHTIVSVPGNADFLGIDGGGTYTLSGDAHLVKQAGEEKIGGGGNGYFIQDGASTHTFQGAMYLGDQAGSYGEYQLKSGTLQQAAPGTAGIVLGEWGGTGKFLQTGGAVSVNDLTLGRQNDPANGGAGQGIYELGAGASLATEHTTVASLGIGGFTQTGGSHVVNQDLSLGLNKDTGTDTSGVGTYTLNGGDLATGNSIVGGAGTGTFGQDNTAGNADHTVNGDLTLGRDSGSTGTYNLSQTVGDNTSTLLVKGNENIGGGGTGTFNQYGGSHTVDHDLNVDATVVGSLGTLNLSGGNLAVHGQANVGNTDAGQGDVYHSGGTAVFDHNLNVATAAGSKGSYNLSGAGALAVTGLINDGNQGTGHITQGAGTTVDAAAVTLGMQSGGNGDYQLSGGSLHTTTGYLVVGDQGTGTFGQTGGGVTVDNVLVLGQSATGHGGYILAGGGTVQSGNFIVGDRGTGIFTNSGGTQTVGGALAANPASDAILGSQAGGTGTYNLGGSGSLNVTGYDYASLIVGDVGVGHFNQTGGTVNANWIDVGYNSTGSDYVQTAGNNTVTNTLWVGRNTGADGAYTLAGSTLATNTTTVGVAGTGSFTQNGASSTHNTGTVVLGYLAGGSGTYNLVNGSLASDWDRIGLASTGIFTQSGGSHTVGTTVVVGQDAGGNGTYHLQGGQLNAGYETIGRYNGSTGLFDQSGGANTVANDLNVGGQGGASGPGTTGQGTYNLTGGTLNAGGTTYVGNQGTGIFTQKDSSFTTASLALGSQAGSTGAYTLTAPASPTLLTVTGHEVVGDAGAGTFTQHAGTHNVGGDLTIAKQTSAGGSSFALDSTAGASSLAVSGNLIVGQGGNGSFTQSGGANTVTGNVNIATQAGSAGSAYTLSGGALAAANLNVNAGGTLHYSGGSLSLGAGGGTLANAGHVDVSGGGTRIVDANVVNDGSFKVTGTTVSYTGSFTNNGAYDSDPSTNLFTNLTVGVNGYLQGGLGDVFKIQGDYSNQSTQYALWDTSQSTLEFTGTGHQVGTTGLFGDFAWGSLILDSGAGFNLTGNMTVGLLSFMDGMSQMSLLSGNFNLYYDSTLAGNAYLLGQNYTVGNGHILAYTPSLASVPEPGTILLMGAGLGGMLFGSRRNNKA